MKTPKPIALQMFTCGPQKIDRLPTAVVHRVRTLSWVFRRWFQGQFTEPPFLSPRTRLCFLSPTTPLLSWRVENVIKLENADLCVPGGFTGTVGSCVRLHDIALHPRVST